LGGRHGDYAGWSIDSPLPSTKETAAKFLTHGHSTSKTLVHHIQPVAIKIHGNIAIVHYYWTRISKSGDKEKETAGRWTDVLMKQNDKWVLIADHGGTPPKS
jgi:ketosteroid isomerase-like protein